MLLQATENVHSSSRWTPVPAYQGTALARQAALAFAAAIRWLRGSATAAVMTTTLMRAAQQVTVRAAGQLRTISEGFQCQLSANFLRWSPRVGK